MEILKIGHLLVIFWISYSMMNIKVRCDDVPDESQHNVNGPKSTFSGPWRAMRRYALGNRHIILNGLTAGFRSLRKDIQGYNSATLKLILDGIEKGVKNLKNDIKNDIENSKTQIMRELHNQAKAALSAVHQLKGCAHPYINRGSSCYWFSKNGANWRTARRACQQFGGQLVEIENKAENDFLNHQMYRHDMIAAWFGLAKKSRNSPFIWWSGKSPAFTNWMNGEPNNYGGKEYCGELYRTSNDLGWNDQDCTKNLGYICKKQH